LITELEFKSLALQGYNRIPLMAEAFADLETPLSLYLKLAHARDGGKHSFLLESVVGGERFGRYSFIGLPARTLLRSSGFGADAATEVVRDGLVVETARAIRWSSSRNISSASRWRCAPGCRAFAAGWPVTSATTRCATSKEAGAKLPARHPGLSRHPAAAMRGTGRDRQPVGQAVPDRLRDPAQGEAYADGKKRLRELRDLLKYSVSAPVIRQTQGFPVEREFAKADYIAAVERAKELIAAGDFMQVQVGQRIKKRYTESPLSLYRALRSLNPSPYMYYYHFGDFHVIGASPKSWCGRSRHPKARRSPSGRWPARGRAARRPSATRPWSRSC